MKHLQEIISKLEDTMKTMTDLDFQIDLCVDERTHVIVGFMFPEKGIITYMTNDGISDDDNRQQDAWVETHPSSMVNTFFKIGMSHAKNSKFGMSKTGVKHTLLTSKENVGNGEEIVRLGFERILDVVNNTHNKWDF